MSTAVLNRRGFFRVFSGKGEPSVEDRDAATTLSKIPPARILIQDCLAHIGSFCTVCSEHCPEPGAIQVEQGRPVIQAGPCTGCGVCQEVCPVPRNAILLLPKPADRASAQRRAPQ